MRNDDHPKPGSARHFFAQKIKTKTKRTNSKRTQATSQAAPFLFASCDWHLTSTTPIPEAQGPGWVANHGDVRRAAPLWWLWGECTRDSGGEIQATRPWRARLTNGPACGTGVVVEVEARELILRVCILSFACAFGLAALPSRRRLAR